MEITKNTSACGIAFFRHNTIIPNILQINRINGKMVEIRFRTGRNVPNLPILNTYVPHMGYNFDKVDTYCNNINTYMGAIPTNLVKIWRADNNGQIEKSGNIATI